MIYDLFVITTYNQQYIQVKDHRIPHCTRCCLHAEPRHTHTSAQAYKHSPHLVSRSAPRVIGDPGDNSRLIFGCTVHYIVNYWYNKQYS